MRWGVWGCSSLIIALVVLMAVVAGIAYVELGEPDSELPLELARAASDAADGDVIDIAQLSTHDFDTLSLIVHGPITPDRVNQCLGLVWDKAELMAGHLAGAGTAGFALVDDGEVVDYGWNLIITPSLTFSEWPCAIDRVRARFVVRHEADITTLSPIPID